MRYLVVDACLSGTGIRDYYEGGYVNPRELNLSTELINQLQEWLLHYQEEHFKGYKNADLIDKLDSEGKEIATIIKDELRNVKIEYFSDAKMKKEII